MATSKWIATKYPGVWFREHPTRKIKKGSIKDRYYCICYRYCGKVKWEAIGWQSQGATVENAVKILATVKTAIREGKRFKSLKEKRMDVTQADKELKQNLKTLAEYWAEIYKPKIKLLYKKSSLSRVDGIFRKWLLNMFGSVMIKDISREHWDALLDKMAAENLSLRTKEYITGELRRILKDAKDYGIPVKNILSGKQIGITAPKNNRRERVITPREGAMILETLHKIDINAFHITKFAFLTGCRFSKCANLK